MEKSSLLLRLLEELVELLQKEQEDKPLIILPSSFEDEEPSKS